MSIDLERDELLTLTQACRLLPRKPSPSTLWRWRTSGVVVNGRRVRLTCIRAGGTWLTTMAAFADFLKQQTEAALETAVTNDHSQPRSSAQSARLKDAGLL